MILEFLSTKSCLYTMEVDKTAQGQWKEWEDKRAEKKALEAREEKEQVKETWGKGRPERWEEGKKEWWVGKGDGGDGQ